MKKTILLFFTLLSSLFSNNIDLPELYRFEGMRAVEKVIENQLQTKSYWEQYLQKKETKYGYYESIEYLLLAQKGLKEIKVLNTKTLEQLFSSDVFVGEKSGDKKIEGDLKTPVGVYKLIRRVTTLDPFYGPLALVTNYPNLFDKTQEKTGHGIWIHGLPQEQRENFTQGCIALDNEKIITLDQTVAIEDSILITSEEQFEYVTKEDLSTVLANIYQWRESWKYSDLEKYLGFYDQGFKKSNTQNFAQFAKMKRIIFNRDEKKTIKFTNINIIPYPNDLGKKMFQVIMDQHYQTQNYKFIGKKELFVEIKNNQFTILAES